MVCAVRPRKVRKLTAADKHAIGEYAKSTGAFKNVVLASPGDYFENFTHQDLAPVFGGFPYIPSEDGALVFRSPGWGGKEEVPFIAIADDYGDIVHGIFLDPERWNGKLVQGVSEIRSFKEAVQDFERGLYYRLVHLLQLLIRFSYKQDDSL